MYGLSGIFQVRLTDTGKPATPEAPSLVATAGTETSLDVGWLELAFTSPVAQGSKPHLRALLNVTGGHETRFRRKDGQLDLWEIRVDPASDDAVTVMLSPSPPCGQTGAVCTEDGRTFTNGARNANPGARERKQQLVWRRTRERHRGDTRSRTATGGHRPARSAADADRSTHRASGLPPNAFPLTSRQRDRSRNSLSHKGL